MDLRLGPRKPPKRARRPSERRLVYALVCPTTDAVRYVGRSSSGTRRAFNHFRAARVVSQPDRCHRWVRGLLRMGLELRVVVLEEVPDGPDADHRLGLAEARWFREMVRRGEPLTNLQETGPGSSGRRLSPQHRRRIGQALRGRAWTPEEHFRHYLAALAEAQPVLCLDDGRVWPCIADAAAFYRLDERAVWQSMAGMRDTAGGRSFEPVELVPPGSRTASRRESVKPKRRRDR